MSDGVEEEEKFAKAKMKDVIENKVRKIHTDDLKCNMYRVYIIQEV
jgi:hypothetical protein